MNWLKVITKSGRQALAKQLLKEYITPENISKWATQGANSLLKRINDKDRLEIIAVNVKRGSEFTTALSSAIEDCEVTPVEADEILSVVKRIVGSSISQDKVDAIIEKAASLVP